MFIIRFSAACYQQVNETVTILVKTHLIHISLQFTGARK
ncbi:hypothetical protein P262_02102 [Cronobacter malonaticus]|uniref:Uncharacterized protein n=1 Tax=Cronobacter malonaticus TaxID=413503 RepID=V5TY47_9ENTR|nr:hypothetical protein P262_02102 [Cronobacter malonaticus]